MLANGPNALAEAPHTSPFQIGIAQFKSLIVWVLIGAGILSAVLGERLDAIAILTIVVLNASIGFYQEYSAEKSIQALARMITPQAKVLRDTTTTAVPTASLVVGDILVLEAGDLVAADARLLESATLKANEAALTGESETVEKNPEPLAASEVPLGDRCNMIFQGTSIAAGTARAVVVATGRQTELGGIASLIETANPNPTTPLQKKLDGVGHILVWATLGIVALLFGLGWLRGTPWLELTMTAVGLAVAAVPEGLPAVVTVALSLGVMRMSRRRALMRKLAAVETLGSTSVICTDKTGTLTCGEMTVRSLHVGDHEYAVDGRGYGPSGDIRLSGSVMPVDCPPLLEIAAIQLGCNNSTLVQEAGTWKVVGDPTEGALLAAGSKAGGNREQLERSQPVVATFPFDSDRKRATTVRKLPNGGLRAYLNGAPDVLLSASTSLYTEQGVRSLDDDDRHRLEEVGTQMASQALRVLGSAYRDLPEGITLDAATVEQQLVFVGLSGMHDPPRQEAREAVDKCRNAGIQVVMITGDHPLTATAIAREIGICDNESAALSGIELDALDDAGLQAAITSTTVFARVTAAHKLRIVNAWKAKGAVVAMTGDGVNDAPAIKGADIGIAMGISGTEVTKEAADMIITDDNFATIVAAVEEGRGVYDNIRKTLQYLLAGNTGELLLMTVCVAVGLPSPLLPIHLLWINLVTDGLPALCLATDRIDPEVMKRQPRSPTERIVNPAFLRNMALTGLLTGGTAFATYLFALQFGSVAMARSCAFSVLVFAELLRAFGARSETVPVWRIPLFSNVNLLVVVGISFALQIGSQHIDTLGRWLHTAPMSFSQGFLLMAVGTLPLVVLELLKLTRNRPSEAAPTLAANHSTPRISP